jgi:hypothetical protein
VETTTVPNAKFPTGPVMWTTAAWFSVLLLMFVTAATAKEVVSYEAYRVARNLGSAVLPALGVATLLFAASRLTKPQTEPWYTSAVLVNFALFWALFPPAWFFIEYLAIDNGAIRLPTLESLERLNLRGEAEQKVKKELLASTKIYADMAAKIWGAVAGALALIVGFGPKR